MLSECFSMEKYYHFLNKRRITLTSYKFPWLIEGDMGKSMLDPFY